MSTLPEYPDSPVVSAAPTSLHLRPVALVTVACGGALGTLARFQLGRSFPNPVGQWPLTTFTINIAGAFVLGMLLESLVRRGDDSGWRRTTRLAVGVGFLGAFTTYSTLAVETNLLVRDGNVWVGLAYLCSSAVLGVLVAAAGIVAGRVLTVRRARP